MAVTKVTDAMRNVTQVDAAKITTGTIPDARSSASSVNAHVDLTAVRQDIAMLAIREAVTANRLAYNLANSFIDQFQDNTGTTTRTDVTNVSEYFGTSSTAVDAGGTSGSWGDANTSHNVATTPTYGTGDDLGMNASSYNYNFISHSSGTESTTGEAMLLADCRSSFTGVTNIGDIETLTSTNAEYYEFGLMTALSVAGTSSLTGLTCDGIYIAFGGNGEDIRIIEKSGTAETLVSTYTTSWTSSQEISLARSGSTMYLQIDKATVYTVPSANFNSSAALKSVWAFGRGAAARAFNNCTFRYSATSLEGISADTFSATGTLISDQQTVPSAITKMSGVILYKENAGDSVLGTHLKIYFSATGTGASDWVEATYTDVTAEFSTGIKMARLGSTTVPSGTLPTMKAVWASQVASSLETQLHGWAMNY